MLNNGTLCDNCLASAPNIYNISSKINKNNSASKLDTPIIDKKIEIYILKYSKY